MTWYANEVIARGSHELLRAVSSDPRLVPFSYHLRPPLEYEWHDSKVLHGLPEEGLAIIRPVGDKPVVPHKSLGERDHVEPVLDWKSFDGSAGTEPVISPSLVAERLGLSSKRLPPVGFLSYLERLARRTQSNVIFYSCTTWAGTVEEEYAWILGQSQSVLVTLTEDLDRNGEPRVVAIDPRGDERVVSGDLLTMALGSVPLHLPTPFFAPHTRGFPWELHRLGAPEAPLV